MKMQPTAMIAAQLSTFLSRHHLPDSFRQTAEAFYLPLAERLPDLRRGPGPLLLGINGAQGTGKSTLAEFLEMATSALYGWRSAVLSIDDFYLTKAERHALAEKVHPLFATRGVPGTHAVKMIAATLDRLSSLADDEKAALPRFDKSTDDREPESEWPVIAGPLDLIVLEGWCVGSRAQPVETLATPVNDLERDEDPDTVWRRYANAALAQNYEPLFDRLDALVFLAAPSFDAIYRWRLEQEQKLAGRTEGSALMDEAGVARFIRFYERITRNNLALLPRRADVILTIDETHAITDARYRED